MNAVSTVAPSPLLLALSQRVKPYERSLGYHKLLGIQVQWNGDTLEQIHDEIVKSRLHCGIRFQPDQVVLEQGMPECPQAYVAVPKWLGDEIPKEWETTFKEEASVAEMLAHALNLGSVFRQLCVETVDRETPQEPSILFAGFHGVFIQHVWPNPATVVVYRLDLSEQA